ncbi:GNAT family N-acetyltransferase [Phocaeicola plebeius]|jgi:putative acetyltransferase|uniref:GNAT family N-acetyltransferase n=1 Tax=Phocaeicola plebeius TaxID=310297 RepID=UPI00241D32C3|nr:GNAT family N-acetyltransferase [Phocaeicola plebeius]
MIREVKKTDYPILVDIWESAVLSTHDFLKKEDFLYYREHLPTYFQYVTLYGYEQDGRLVGFIGVAENNIEMLFVHNDYRYKGVGKRLVMYAIEKLQVCKVDVNEQNIQAVGFYQHRGFSVITRSDLDAEGKAYPILHMRR